MKNGLLLSFTLLLASNVFAQTVDVQNDLEACTMHYRLSEDAAKQTLENVERAKEKGTIEAIKKISGITAVLLKSAIKNADTAAQEADRAEEGADYFCEMAAVKAYDAENAFKKAANDLKKAKANMEHPEKATPFLGLAITHLNEGLESLQFAHEDIDKALEVLKGCE